MHTRPHDLDISLYDSGRVRVEPLPGAPSDHTFVAEDGTTRPAYYGDGVQPWDTIKTRGWAPHFAAGCVVKYLRRTKEVDESRLKAIWYYRELARMAVADSGPGWSDASLVLCQLIHELTYDELALVRAS